MQVATRQDNEDRIVVENEAFAKTVEDLSAIKGLYIVFCMCIVPHCKSLT